MTPKELQPGQPYYRIGYADRDLTIPSVEPLIYIGANVLQDHDATSFPMYSFQDTVSFVRFGSAVDYHGPADLLDEGVAVYSFTEPQLDDLTNLAGAVQALTEALARARTLGT